MKAIKATPAILLASLMSLNVMAQKINSAKVPAVVQKAFETTYPGIKTVKWEKENSDFEAGFKQGTQEMSAVFKADGSAVEHEAAIKTSDLPAASLTYIRQNYKNTTIKDAAKITKASGEVNYEAGVNGKDLLFDEKGKFIKAVKD